jgi:DNA polymerase-3 subunit delta'
MATPVEASEDAPAPSKTAKPSQDIKVDQVRELVDFLNIGSHRGKRRLAIFHPAEAMNANAANSLLKSLEDPASGVCFILVSNNPRYLIPTIRSRCISLAVGLPDEEAALAWLKQESVTEGAQWLRFSGGAPLLAREYADSPRGEKIAQVIELMKKGGRDALSAWPAADREQIEILSEVLQKWAMDKAFLCISGKSKYFPAPSGSKGVQGNAGAWLKFAREAGRYRLAAQHPLNPKLFAADLISRMPE